MTAQDRRRHEKNQQRQNPALPSEGRASAVGGRTGVWLIPGLPLDRPGVVWLIRPMPDGQWPPNPRAPRDDSFSWLVRSHCGHQGGSKLWAFCKREDAQQYEQIFRADPCRYTRCPDRTMTENDGRRR